MVRNYELMYIIRPDRDEEGIETLVERVHETVETLGGKVHSVVHNEPWGRRRLAYPIDKVEEGLYVLTYFALEPEHLGELERVLKLSDGILRYLLTRRPE